MQFKELAVDRYFRFEAHADVVYKKLSAGRIRKLGTPEIVRYLKNEPIEDLGDDIFQFVSPIHVKVRKTKLPE